MRDEVYRFGIIFYSLTGKPSEVKWIDDIRFPCAGDFAFDDDGYQRSGLAQYAINNPPLDANGTPRSFFGNPKIPINNSGTKGFTIGIEFNVDVSSIADKISGYSIVRAPRREKDRTIIAEGYMHRVKRERIQSVEDSVNTIVSNAKLYPYDEILNEPSDLNAYGNSGFSSWDLGTLDCPDLKFANTGAKLKGYEDLEGDDGKYILKPVGLYSHLGNPDDIIFPPKTNGGSSTNVNRYTGAPLGLTGFDIAGETGFDSDIVDSVTPQDFYAKATVLRHNNTFRERIVFSQNFGPVKDIFFVDKNAINVPIGTSSSTFTNQSVIGQVTDGSGIRRPKFIAKGVSTILFAGFSNSIAKLMINHAGGFTGSTQYADPYELEPNTLVNTNNNLDEWGYFGDPVKRKGHYAIVDIYRDLEEQYGGATLKARETTQYMTTGHYQSVNINTSFSEAKIWGGDITTALYTEKKFYAPSNADGPIGERDFAKVVRGIIVPLQTAINTELRTLIHFNNYNSNVVSGVDIETHRTNDFLDDENWGV